MQGILIKEVSNSSNISGLKYIVATKSLEITFTSGEVYRYDDVPKDTSDELFGADSVGKAFFAKIKGKFNFTKLS